MNRFLVLILSSSWLLFFYLFNFNFFFLFFIDSWNFVFLLEFFLNLLLTDWLFNLRLVEAWSRVIKSTHKVADSFLQFASFINSLILHLLLELLELITNIFKLKGFLFIVEVLNLAITFIEKGGSFFLAVGSRSNIWFSWLSGGNWAACLNEHRLIILNKDVTPDFLTESEIIAIDKSEESAVFTSKLGSN